MSHGIGPLYTPAGPALLRIPLLPYATMRDTWYDGEYGEPSVAGAIAQELTLDPCVREAVAVSSDSLDTALERLDTQKRAAALRRAAVAAAAYRVRMATRATPFGLMAGVATASFTADRAGVRFGPSHTKTVRPDRAWLADLVRRWERDPAVLLALRVTANPLAFVRGDRLVVPYVPDARAEASASAATGSARRVEVSVRHTPAVQRVLAVSRRQVVTGADLHATLAAAYLGVSSDTLTRLLCDLVVHEILLTDLRPPLEAEEPIAHVLTVLKRALPAGVQSSLHRAAGELSAVGAALDAYAALPVGEGIEEYRALARRMAEMSDCKPALQVDLRMDAEVELPQEVAREAARAAEVLWRITGPHRGSEELVRYHTEFLERYGVARPVPVLRLLDAETGLGAPAGYAFPPSHRLDPPARPCPPARLSMLAELAFGAAMDGRWEVVLDDRHLEALGADHDDLPPDPSAEVYAELSAASPQALAAGEFLLVMSTGGVTVPGGSTAARFGALLGEVGAAGAVVEPVESGREEVQLMAHPVRTRSGNVVQTPRLRPRQIVVGGFADPAAEDLLRLEDLAIVADLDRLRVISLSSGHEVLPVALNRLNPHRLPNCARFLREVSSLGTRAPRPWSWEELEGAPFLPRIRYGRTVLSPARWRPTDLQLTDPELPAERWEEAFRSWCARWKVPDTVCLSARDHRLIVKLTVPLHRELIRRRMHRNECVLQEVIEPGGWLTGPDGAHAGELVIPLASRPAQPAAAAAAPLRVCRPKEPPAWLFGKVYASAALHGELITRRLPGLLAELPPACDRWFFIRYRDPDPHLRLRFHADVKTLDSQVLPVLRGWAETLQCEGLASRFVIDGYDPELERYGGPALIGPAEEFFAADSVAVARQLTLLDEGRSPLPLRLLTAANYVDLTTRFFAPPDGPEADRTTGLAAAWMLATYPKEREREAFRRHRREAVTLIDPGREWIELQSRPGGLEILETFRQRGQALARFAAASRAAATARDPWVNGPRTLRGFLHMHHNRLAGIDPAHERQTEAVARGVYEAYQARRRHTP